MNTHMRSLIQPSPRINLRKGQPLDPFEREMSAMPVLPPPVHALTLRWSWFWAAMVVGGVVEDWIVYLVLR